MYDDYAQTLLVDQLQSIADAEDGPKESGGVFGTKPTRWWEPKTHWRCVNEHVSTALLGTDHGRVCLACYEPVWLTFPEDRDGPLGATP